MARQVANSRRSQRVATAALLIVSACGDTNVSDVGVDSGGLDAGRDAPGLDAPGLDAPGFDAPGLDAPGFDALGFDAPSADAPTASPDTPEADGSCFAAAATDAPFGTLPPLDREMARLVGLFDARFGRAEDRYLEFEGWFVADTNAGELFYKWGQALAYMFDATEHTPYALELARLAALALRNRDDALARPDSATGIEFPSWATTNNTSFVGRYASIGAGTLITTPIAHLYWIMSRYPAVAAEVERVHGLTAEELYDRVMETILAFDRADELRDGHYLYPARWRDAPCRAVPPSSECTRDWGNAGLGLAYNVQVFPALTLIYLNHVRRDCGLHARIEGIVGYFLRTGELRPVTTTPEVATVFSRADRVEFPRTSPEDVGHANNTVDLLFSLVEYQRAVPELAPLIRPELLAEVGRALGLATLPGPLPAPDGGVSVCSSRYCFRTFMDGTGAPGDRSLQEGCQLMMLASVAAPQLGVVCADRFTDGRQFSHAIAAELVARRWAQLGWYPPSP